LIDAGLMQSGG